MEGIECKVNLIMFNPHQGTPFTASSMEQVEAFRDVIMQVLLSIITTNASSHSIVDCLTYPVTLILHERMSTALAFVTAMRGLVMLTRCAALYMGM